MDSVLPLATLMPLTVCALVQSVSQRLLWSGLAAVATIVVEIVAMYVWEWSARRWRRWANTTP